MKAVQIFIIRIYRRDAGSPAGLIEEVPNGRTTAFRSLHELRRLLLGYAPLARRRRGTTSTR